MNFVDVFDQLGNVAQIARKCPTPVLRRVYVKVMRDWCVETQWLRVNIVGATVADQEIYTLGDDPDIEIIGIYAMSGSQVIGNQNRIWPIAPSNSGSFDPNMPVNRPVRYAYVPEGEFALYPVPNDVYGLTVTAIVQPKDGVTRVPATPLKKYSTTFEAGALANLLKIHDQPWYNPALAAQYAAIYNSGISNGKAEVQRNFNTGAQRIQPRGFVA